MPYRRLPNTDAARIRAMKAAIERIDKYGDYEQAVPFDIQYKLKIFYPEFVKAVDLYNQAYKRQIEIGKVFKEDFRLARMYLSHFLQVFNMAIMRKEIKAEEREFFELPSSSFSLPKIQTEKELLYWGEIVIKGEEKRIAMGRTPITNPKISLVKIYFERFKENYFFYKRLQEITAANLKNVSDLRPKIDSLIKKMWDAIEDYFSDLPPKQKREKAKTYGVIYFYRKEEKVF